MSKSDRRRVGIYGGTFDPVHFGHINLALAIQDQLQLDEVWFCPAHCSPHKTGEEQTATEHRLAMLQLAIEDIPTFSIYDWELQQEPPSYTINTVRELLGTHDENTHFTLLMGDDSLAQLHKWAEIEEIVELLPLAIGARRREAGIDNPQLPPKVREAVEKGLVNTPQMDISATDLRQRLKNKVYCGHLLPQKVLDYISKHDLYCSS